MIGAEHVPQLARWLNTCRHAGQVLQRGRAGEAAGYVREGRAHLGGAAGVQGEEVRQALATYIYMPTACTTLP